MITRFASILVALPSIVFAQSSVLDDYVKTGLDQNLVVQQSRLSMQTSRERVSEARSFYLPSLDLQARYTMAAGGRTIVFPAGDLLNPAYGALNELVADGSSFPAVSNEEIRFLRSREQETKLRLTQPIFQPAVIQNMRIQSSLSDAAVENLDATRRQVVADIKTSYYRYLAAEKAVLIFEEALELVAENLRVSQGLFDNGKATADVVYRAKAEVSTVEQQLEKARTDRDLSRSSFNLTLNQDLNTPIRAESVEVLLADAKSRTPIQDDEPILLQHALSGREELRQIAYTADAADANLKLARSSYLPNVSFALDYGIQGTGYSFSSDSDFRAASVVVSWNIFNGLQTRSQAAQAQLQRQQVETQQELVSRQIELEVQNARKHLDVARRSIRTAEDRLLSARQTYKLVSRRYQEGMATQVELLDSRTSLTRAELNLTLTQFDLLGRYADVERSAALYPLHQ